LFSQGFLRDNANWQWKFSKEKRAQSSWDCYQERTGYGECGARTNCWKEKTATEGIRQESLGRYEHLTDAAHWGVSSKRRKNVLGTGHELVGAHKIERGAWGTRFIGKKIMQHQGAIPGGEMWKKHSVFRH